MTSHWWVIARNLGTLRHPRWCFWSNRLHSTDREADAAKFRTADAAREHAAAWPVLQAWNVLRWWPGRFK